MPPSSRSRARGIIVVDRRPGPRPRSQRAPLLRAHARSSARLPLAPHALMYAGSKAFFYALSRSALLKRLASQVRPGDQPTASPAGSSPARRSSEAIETRARAAVAGAAAHARLPRRERQDARRGDGRHARVRAADRRHRRRRHRAEHLAEADAARHRRRPRDLRRQPAAHPRAGGAPRFLRPHRHGELALHRADARDLRDAVGAGLSQRRRGAAVVPVSHRARRPAHERARRARAARQGRLQGAAVGRVPAEGRRATRRSSG